VTTTGKRYVRKTMRVRARRNGELLFG
jgi:hypothetical protein